MPASVSPRCQCGLGLGVHQPASERDSGLRLRNAGLLVAVAGRLRTSSMMDSHRKADKRVRDPESRASLQQQRN